MLSTQIAIPDTEVELPGSAQFWESLWLQLKDHTYWSTKLRSAGFSPEGLCRPYEIKPEFSVHLGVFVEPYLQYVLDGSKTIESRFSVRRFAPYGYAKDGDIVLLKKSAGPVVGVCCISHVWFYHLDPQSWKTIRSQFTDALRAEDPEFWTQREGAEFATLMRIKHVQTVSPIPFQKRDRRGWSVLFDGASPQNSQFQYPHSGLLADI